ncbi:MAG: energy-coupling factor ABC transporter permease [Thiolinea sp.]
MDIPAHLISIELRTLSAAFLLAMLAFAAYTAPWHFVRRHSHVYFGAIVLTGFIWVLRAGIGDGLNLHLLGMVMLTLMFGWRLALIAATIIVSISFVSQTLELFPGVMTPITAVNRETDIIHSLSAIPLNTLFMAGIPILLTHYMLVWTEKKLPANFFIYIFINAFLTGALSILAVISCGTLLMLVSGAYDWSYLQANYLPFIPLLMFPEALMNGMLMTVFVIYTPDWVRSFHDRHYLRKR